MIMRFRPVLLLTHRPVLVFIVLLCITAIAAGFAARTRFEFSPQAIFEGNDALIRDLEEFKHTFGYEDSVLMVILEATGQADVLDRHVLDWQAELVQRAGRLPHIVQTASIATIEVPRRTLGLVPDVVARPLITTFPVDENGEERVRRMVADSPLIQGTLISTDRRVGAVLLFLDPEVRRVEDLRRIVADVRNLTGAFPPPAGYRASLTGLPYLRVDTVANLQADQAQLLPLAGVVYLIALTVIFRRLSGAVLPLLAVGMGLVWTIGLMTALGASFNLVTNVLPVMLMVVGISNCVHILDDYAEQFLRAQGDRLKATELTIRHMSRSCFLTFFTTAVGFASLLLAHSNILRQFAWQAAAGMVCLYVTILGTLGCLMRYFRPLRRSAAGAPLGHLVAISGHIIDHHPRTTLLVSALLVGGSLWLARSVPINSYMIETYEESHPTLQTLRLVERELSGLLPIEVHLVAQAPDRLVEPDIVRRVAELEQRTLAQPDVLFARSYADLLQAIAAGQPGRDDGFAAETEADLQNDLRRGLWVVRRVGESLGYPQFMSDDGRNGRILIKVRDVGTRRLAGLIRWLNEDVQSTFPPGSGVTAHLTGDAYINTVVMNKIIRDLFYSLLMASLIIFASIAVLLRSLRLALIAAIPNLTPLTMTLGYIGLCQYDMNVANVIVFTISLGIAVDDSIHFLFRFREEMKRTGDVEQAVDQTFEGTGRAIVMTSVLVVSGLSVLLFSHFVPTRRFAELTSVTMVAALVGVLLLLPACLVMFTDRSKTPQPVAAAARHASEPPDLSA